MTADVVPIRPGQTMLHVSDIMQRIRELKFGYTGRFGLPKYVIIGGNFWNALVEQVKKQDPTFNPNEIHQIHGLFVVRLRGKTILEIAE